MIAVTLSILTLAAIVITVVLSWPLLAQVRKPTPTLAVTVEVPTATSAP